MRCLLAHSPAAVLSRHPEADVRIRRSQPEHASTSRATLAIPLRGERADSRLAATELREPGERRTRAPGPPPVGRPLEFRGPPLADSLRCMNRTRSKRRAAET